MATIRSQGGPRRRHSPMSAVDFVDQINYQHCQDNGASRRRRERNIPVTAQGLPPAIDLPYSDRATGPPTRSANAAPPTQYRS